MSKVLYELVSKQKINQVLNCVNLKDLVKEDGDDAHQIREILKIYASIPNTDKGKKIMYEQTNGFGRYHCKFGAQTFKREIRKFLFHETHLDIDIVNCHPVLLQQLFEQHNILCKELIDYNTDRKKFLEEHKMSKQDLLKLINKENLSVNVKVFRNIHDRIYKDLYPKLMQDDTNKMRYKHLVDNKKKCKSKDYNYKGTFIATYLQNIECEILMCMCDFVQKRGFIVSSYIHDGFMIEKSDLADDALLKSIEEHVSESLGWKIKLAFESLEPDWLPDIVEDVNFVEERLPDGSELDIEKICSFKLDDDETKSYKLNEFVSYLNNFICEFHDPLCYGYRYKTSQEFKFVKSNVLYERIGSNVKYWKQSNLRKKYDKQVFIVDKNHPDLKENVFNLYQAPSQKFTDAKCLKDISPLSHDYFYRLIVNKSNDNYDFLMNYFSKLTQVGKTEITIFLMGQMGIGKSTFSLFPSLLVGSNERKYSAKYDTYSDIENRFNVDAMTNLITVVEELPTDTATYHKFQNKLKTLTTEKFMMFEQKGVDRFKGESLNNFILCTNGINPINPTIDNRRYAIFEVNPEEKGNREYFKKLREEIFEKIEYLRYFFNHFEYNDDLISLYTKTEAEQNLLELNENISEKYIREQIDQDIKDILFYREGCDNDEDVFVDKSNTKCISLRVIYDEYTKFFNNHKSQQKALSINYFSNLLKKYRYDIVRRKIHGKKITCIEVRGLHFENHEVP